MDSKEDFFYMFTVFRGNLMLKNNVPQFLPNYRYNACLVAKFNAAVCLLGWGLNPHPQAVISPTAPRQPHFVFIRCRNNVTRAYKYDISGNEQDIGLFETHLVLH